MLSLAEPLDDRRVQTRTKRRHMVLDGVNSFGLALIDDGLAGDVELLRENVDSHFLDQGRSPCADLFRVNHSFLGRPALIVRSTFASSPNPGCPPEPFRHRRSW